jgi:hypothetical protein
VSDTTLDIDLGRKCDLYAASGIAKYWVMDLTESRVLMHKSPSINGHEGQHDIPFGEKLVVGTIERVGVSKDRLLH